MINRARKSWAAVGSAALAVIELPLALIWALGPGLFWRDNVLTNTLTRPMGWFYDQYVKGDRKGWLHPVVELEDDRDVWRSERR